MAVKVSHWHSYLRVILSLEGQRMEHFQRAENILLTVLEKVTAMDPRFIADYSRNLEDFEFALCTSEDAVTVGVPLWIADDALLLQECSSKLGQLETVTNGHHQMSGCCHLGVPKEGAGWENWTKEDVFSVVDSAECRGHIVPGKVLRVLKELIVAAIVYCRHQFLIKPCLYSTNHPVMKLLHIAGTLKGHHLDCLRLLDQVNSEDWKEEGRKSRLTFNHLKMVLLWATEMFPSPEDWEYLEGSVYQLLVILLCCLATKNLPHFLYPEDNLFQGEDLDLSALYHRVEGFASSLEHFLKCHFTQAGQSNHQWLDNGIKTLQLPAQDEAYWDTAYFDVLLSKFQVYRNQDKERISALLNILSKVKKVVNDQS
ncbi:LOW QUALITY PROTEIN: protein mab-21-like 4 [Macrochelys suwanniensis]